MTVGAVYKAAVELVNSGQVLAVNVFHFRETAASPGHSAQDLSDDLKSFLDTNLRPITVANMTFLRTTAQRMIPNLEDVFETIWPNAATGTLNGGAVSPSPLCLLVQLKTPLNSKRARGRIFFAGMHNSYSSAFAWGADNQQRVATFMTAMLARYKSGGTPGHYELGVWSRVNGGSVAPFNTAGFQPVTNWNVDPFFRVQRRREFI
jgi:hypothetical protein